MKSNRTKVTRSFIGITLFLSFIGVLFISSFSLKNTNNPSLILASQQVYLTKQETSSSVIVNEFPKSETKISTPFPTQIIKPVLISTPTSPFVTNTPDAMANIYHIVLPSESLENIANLYGTSIENLREINWMLGNTVLPGQKLLVNRGNNWLPQYYGYSRLKADSINELSWAYPSSFDDKDFTLHYMPQTYPAVDPESLSLLMENGLNYNEMLFNRPLNFKFDIFAAGKFFEIPNQYLRGHSFGKDLYIVFLHDGSGDAIDQQYLTAHEMTHFYMWNTFGQPNSFLLSEGTAVWVGKSITNDSDYIQLEPFCKAYQMAGQLPLISDIYLPYKGQNYDLENYYAAGCYVKYLVETYGVDKLGEIYSNADYESVYGKTLPDLENEWHGYLRNLGTPIGFDYEELISLNDQLKSAYHKFFASIFTSPEMLDPYIALDQARLAMLSMRFEDSKTFLKKYYELIE